MRTGFVVSLIVACTLALAGCPDGAPVAPTPQATPTPEGAFVTGTVKAPLKLLAGEAETPESDAGLSEGTVASAVVGLADALGHPLPGVVPATTDAQGRFTLQRLPAGHVVLVVAQFKAKNGRQAVLSRMVKTEAAGLKVEVDLATTLVTTEMARALDGFDGPFEAEAFEGVVGQMRGKLTDAMAPDLTSTEAIAGALNTLKSSDPALAAALQVMRRTLNPRAN